MFAIHFANVPVEYPYDDPSASAAFGELILGDANPEGFVAALAVWDKPDYQAHWKRELKLLLAGQMEVTPIADLPDLLFRVNTECGTHTLMGTSFTFIAGCFGATTCRPGLIPQGSASTLQIEQS